MIHTHELRVHRRAVQLNHEELAHLIGVSPSMVLRMEQGAAAQLADLQTMIALEIVFGKPLTELFSVLFTEVEDAVMRRTAELHAVWETLDDAKSNAKIAFANALASRARSSHGA